MKKLLSAVLSCVMLFGLMIPMTVSADAAVVSATGDTIINVTADLVQIPLAAGGTFDGVGTSTGQAGCFNDDFVRFNANSGPVAADYTVSIPFTVEAAGFYDVVSQISKGLNTTTITIDSTTISDGTIVDDAEKMTWGGGLRSISKTVYLTAEAHTLNFTIKYESSRIAKCLDGVKFTPAGNSESISSTEATRVEMEKYASLVSVPTASGDVSATTYSATDTTSLFSKGSALFLNQIVGSNSTHTITVPVTIEETGLYNFMYQADSSWCTMTVKVDSTSISNDTTAATTTTLGSFAKWGTINYYKFTSSAPLSLIAGTHNVTFTITANSSGKFIKTIDCFEFSPYALDVIDPVEVGEDETFLEVEDYANTAIYTDANGNAFLPGVGTGSALHGGEGWWIKNTNMSNYIEITMPVVLTKTGNYDIRYLTNNNWMSNTSQEVYIDGAKVAFLEGYEPSEGAIFLTGNGFPQADSNGRTYLAPAVYLEAGEYDVVLRVLPDSGTRMIRDFDYVSLDWTDDPYYVPERVNVGEDKHYLEIEDYVNAGTYTGADDNTYKGNVYETAYAHGDGFVYFPTGKKAASADVAIDYDMDVNLAKAGNYDFEMIANRNYGARIDILVDGEVVLANLGGDGNNEYVDADNSADYFKATGVDYPGNAACYNRTIIFEEAGDHTVTLRLRNRGGEQLDFVKCIDYIALDWTSDLEEEVEDAIGYAEGKVSATKVVGETTGTVLLALYNGKEFVGVVEGTIVDGVATAEYEAAAGTFTDAKLFVWADCASTYAPLFAPLTWNIFD